jgi:hypothetical protein
MIMPATLLIGLGPATNIADVVPRYDRTCRAISLWQADEVVLLRRIEALITRSIPATGQRSVLPL